MNLVTLGSYLLDEGKKAGIDPDKLIARMVEMVQKSNQEMKEAGDEMLARLTSE